MPAGATVQSSRRRIPSAEVLLVCSPGGHLLQLEALREAWEPFTRVWVTLEASDSVSLLADERCIFAYGPTVRNGLNALRNAWLAWRVLRAVRPQVLLTTGAGIAVPFAWLARLFSTRVVFVESLTRVATPSLSGRLIKPVASLAYCQWPELAAPARMRYVGAVIERR